jgi:hypothetical protein
MTIWKFMFLCLGILVVAGVLLGGLLLLRNNEQIKHKWEASEAEAKKAREQLQQAAAEQQSQIVVAENLRAEVIAAARTATNQLTRLLQEVNTLFADAEALKTNEAGRAIAANSDLVPLARRFYEAELPGVPAPHEITAKLESARRIEQQLLAAQGTPFPPQADLQTNSQELVSWSAKASVKYDSSRQALALLISESKIRVSPSQVNNSTSTLATALANLVQADVASRLRSGEAEQSKATEDAYLTKVKAEAARIREEAETEAKRILSEVSTKQKEVELALEEKEAALKVELARVKAAVQQNLDEAGRIELRQKASQPEVLAELAPFTTPGYLQIDGIKVEKKPYSYAALRNYGALSPDADGMRKLVRLASHPQDNVRPRWKMNHLLFQRKPSEVEKVARVQGLLTELGPVLVEKGLLQP